MCGITGICNYGKDPKEQIAKMNRQIIRRGPDGDGYFDDKQAHVAFGHRRLSILDLTDAGSQPMLSEDSRYVLTYNGEIYNYRTIKKELCQERPDLMFRGTSDTELLLYALIYYGVESTLNKIKGMFAFAFYDRDRKELFLARDRMGEKPLYYGMVNGSFVFASDVAGIRALEGFQNKINDRVLGIYFRNGYIPAPYTIYRDIYKLDPGSYLLISSPFSKWKIQKYWDIKEVARYGQEHPYTGSFDEASMELERRLKEAVSGQMISDVALGAFLSGGIDSTLTVSLMQSLSKEPVRTFTIGFEDTHYNEAEYAKETAAYLGTEHTQLYVTKEDVMKALLSIPQAYAEPFADSSQIPTMLVSQMTRKHVTVSLSGDAGDEFFCGYNSYKEIQNGLSIMRGKLPFLKDPLRHLTGEACIKMAGKQGDFLHKVGQCLCVRTVEELYRAIQNDDYRTDFLPLERKQCEDVLATYPDGYLKGPESNLMLMDMLEYLPDDILTKVDRAGMFYSLETRIPLLDKDIMEFAWTLPHEYKYKNGETKRILKDVLYRYVPKSYMERPKKGFSIPVADWLRDGMMKEWAYDILKSAEDVAGEYLDYRLFWKIWQMFQKGGEFHSSIYHVLIFLQWLLEEKGP